LPKEPPLARPDGGGEIDPGPGGVFRWGLFGCFGLLAAIGVVIVIVSLVIAMNR